MVVWLPVVSHWGGDGAASQRGAGVDSQPGGGAGSHFASGSVASHRGAGSHCTDADGCAVSQVDPGSEPHEEFQDCVVDSQADDPVSAGAPASCP